MKRQTTYRAIMRTIIDFLFYNPSTPRANFRCVSGIYSYGISTSTFSLVLNHVSKLPPSGIMYAFGKSPLRHFFNIQILIPNQSVFVHNHGACFMQKIISLIVNFSMKCRQLTLGGFPHILRIFGLNAFQFFFRLFQVSRIFNPAAIRKNSKTFQSQINPNSGRYDFFRNNHILFRRKNNIPLPGSFNRTGFNIANDLMVKFYLYATYFRKQYPASFNLKPALGIADRTKSFFALKSWEPCLLPLFYPTKKMFKSYIKPFQNILQYLGMYVRKFRELFFDSRKFVCLHQIGDTFTSTFISSNTMFQSRIVQPAAEVELLFNRFTLQPVWVTPIFIRLNHFNKNNVKQNIT